MLKQITILAALALPIATWAHDNQKNPEIRYRHAVMEAMSNQVEAMALILQGKVERADEMQVSARALAESATLVSGLFPENSKGADALPLIWEEPEKVAAAAKRSVEATIALAAAAESGAKGEIAKAFKGVADACKGCHERYKAEDE
jgi:cytochrome c556